MNIPRFLAIDGQAHLIRDRQSMGIINTNRDALKAAKIRQEVALKQKQKEQQYQTEINSLRTELKELKELLRQVLEKNN